MKVHVVLWMSEETVEVKRVFTTRRKAVAFCKQHADEVAEVKDSSFRWYDIAEEHNHLANNTRDIITGATYAIRHTKDEWELQVIEQTVQ